MKNNRKKNFGGTTRTIAIRFGENDFTSKKARDWLKKHDLKQVGKALSTTNTRIYEIGKKTKDEHIVTEKLPGEKNISLILAAKY